MKHLKIPANVGQMSLIGVGKERPISWGNYFWFWDGPRCVNFWAENLESASKFLKDGFVNIISWQHEDNEWCIIKDDRIPENWYYNKLCFTGYYKPTKEIAREMYDILGDPTNEYEQFVDPISYYEKRGSEYRNGLIITKVTAKPRQLKGTWTVSSYAPYIPKEK